MTATAVDYAKFYASKGWDVFPCLPGDKKPAVKWADVATKDAGQIIDWWKHQPNANIGIATGARSGLVVIDIDTAHDGEESAKGLALPETVTAHTGGGGRHLLYAHPGREIRNSASKLAKGIDVRGDGGYIVAPPSLHPSGNHYQWAKELAPSKHALAPMPEWMITSLTTITTLEYPQTPEPAAQAATTGDVFAPGTRNATLASLAGTMRRRGMSEEAIYTALLKENQAKCNPPLSPNEVAAIAKSVTRYQPTAAPAHVNGERVKIEWAFCYSVFNFAHIAQDFLYLQPELFFDDGLSRFWAGILDGKTPNFAAAEAGILTDLERAQGNPDNVDQYARELLKWSYLDGVVSAAENIKRIASSGNLEKTAAAVEAMSEKKLGTVALSATNASDGLDELIQSIETGQDFIKTRLGNYDQTFGGLELQTLSILAARPSMGKTTLAWQIARNVASSGRRVLFLSLEMTAVELWRKAAYGIAEITSAAMAEKRVPAETLERLRNEIVPNLKEAYDGKLYTFDKPPYSTAALTQVIAQVAPELVIIDHLEYIEYPQGRDEKTVDVLGKITKWGKKVAKKYNCHVMILHQLSRELEKRAEKEPKLSDLRDSGHIEQDADVVIFPHRPEYHADPNAPKKRYSETYIYVRKNRNNPIGNIALFYDMRQQWFYQKHELPNNYASEML
jgi:replicative DNA helicase